MGIIEQRLVVEGLATLMVGIANHYFAFVFGRAAKIKAQMDKERKAIEIEAGGKVR